MKKIILAGMGVLALSSVFLMGCSQKMKQQDNLDTTEKVNLTIAGPWEDAKALEELNQKFETLYPNCTIVYEYVQDYQESMLKRLDSEEDKVDMFFTTNVQADSPYIPYVLDLYTREDLDLSDTYDGLIANFVYIGSEKEGKAKLYCIPTGGEVRGMYVNHTLLDSLNLKVPENKDELLEECETLKQAGYIPMQGNPGMFGQQIFYPYICNMIANSEDYQATYDKVNACGPDLAEMFEEPMQTMYTMMSNGYYNYKYVETELGAYTDNSNTGQAKSFFHVVADENGVETADDPIGQVPFCNGTLTMLSAYEKVKDDFHSPIEYSFEMAPISDEGGYAYMSPATGMAVNRNSDNTDWVIAYLNFFFTEKINKAYAEEAGIIPNIKGALKYMEDKFSIPENHVSQLGQVTFDYAFYNTIDASLMEVAKGNNPKYMKDGTSIYDFDYYMNRMQLRFDGQRTGEDLLGDAE